MLVLDKQIHHKNEHWYKKRYPCYLSKKTSHFKNKIKNNRKVKFKLAQDASSNYFE